MAEKDTRTAEQRKQDEAELQASQEASEVGMKAAQGKTLEDIARAEGAAQREQDEANVLREQGVDPEQARLDEVEEGGRYIIGDRIVNANGEAIK